MFRWVTWLVAATGLSLVSAQEAPPPAPAPVVHPLRQLLITVGIEEAQKLTPVPEGPFVVLTPNLSMLDAKELRNRLAPGENRPIDEPLLAAIAQVVEVFLKQSDFPVAVAVIPPQNIAGGVVRVAVLLGKIRDIKVEGNNWFSNSLLQEKLRIERGETVRISELNRSVAWTNNNPFRRVRMHIEPVPGTGEADLIVTVQEKAPFRFSLTYDNTGNEVLGNHRTGAAITYGNAWGRDHQVSYQYVTTNHTDIFRAQGLEYRAPLPWRHLLVATANYARVTPSFFEGLFTQVAESISSDIRYVAPFTRGAWQGELSALASFKRTNNNLEFAGTPALNATADLITLTLTAAGMREDARGRWLASASVIGSPGEFNSRSNERVYFDSRIGSKPLFAYGQISGARLTRLTPNLTSTLRGMFQLASTNLLPSEQLSIGGASSVRGYKERILGGDGGYVFTHELQQRLPSIPLGKKLPAVDTAAVVFWDYGRTIVKHPLRGQEKSDYLASAGIGLRASVGNNFSASIDVARQLEEIAIEGERHHRVHLRVSLAY